MQTASRRSPTSDAAADRHRRRGRPHADAAQPDAVSDLTGAEVWLKFENLQFTAAYKERGALNKLLQLTDGAARARRDRRLGRQPCAGGRLSRQAPWHAGDDRHAEAHADDEGHADRKPRRACRARRRELRRRPCPCARARSRGRADIRPSVRRPADHRRGGHGGARDARRRARARHAVRADRRRRADLGHGDRGQGARSRHRGRSASRPSFIRR